MRRSRSARRLTALAGLVASLALVASLSASAGVLDESGAGDPAEVQAEDGHGAGNHEVTAAQVPTVPLGFHPCVRGRAGPFPCHQIDLLSFLPPSAYGGGPTSQFGGPGNVVEGWTDP